MGWHTFSPFLNKYSGANDVQKQKANQGKLKLLLWVLACQHKMSVNDTSGGEKEEFV